MKILLLVVACLFLSACSADDTDNSAETVGEKIADDYNQMLDKAGNVEDQLFEQKDIMDEALDDAEDSLRDP